MKLDNFRKIRQARANARAKTANALARKEAKRERKEGRVNPIKSAYAVEKEALKIVDSTTVEGWFRERIKEDRGHAVIVSAWTVPQMTLAKRLLSTYGEELVKRGVAWVFDNWDEIQKTSRSRLGGVPTISVLWGFRETVFVELQTVKGTRDVTREPKNSDEYRERAGRPKIGW